MKLQISYLFLQDETFSLTQPPQSYVRDTGGPRYIPTAACTYVTLVHKKKKKNYYNTHTSDMLQDYLVRTWAIRMRTGPPSLLSSEAHTLLQWASRTLVQSFDH